MSISKRTSVALLATLALLASSCSSAPRARSMSVDEIIALETKAAGGAAAQDHVHAVRIDAEVEEPTFKVTGRYFASDDGRMRVDIFKGDKRVYSEGIDRKGGWVWEGEKDQAEPSSPAAAAALVHGIEFNLFGLHRYAQRGHLITLEGREVINGRNYWVLKIRLEDGFETYRYIDPKTWLITRQRDYRAFHPDLNAQKSWLETENLDFRRLDGVMTPFLSVTHDLTQQGKVVGRNRVVLLEHNPRLTEPMLSRPN